ncbi:MAG: TatD family hydrolase [Flavobacteriales bacterium]|nr:TatD family hydrolase [Flavobacteriales bacterium]
MNFIDTHTHLFASEFDNDIDIVIKNALDNGISKMLLPNIDSTTTTKMLQLCNKYPNNCYPMVGLHPCSIKKDNLEKEISHVEQMLSQNKFIAVGEIGLDLYWDKSTLDLQKIAFESQIELAKKYQLPIVIHVRDSFDEAIEIVERLNDYNLSGVFHCFTGNLEEAQRIINLNNFYLGIGGVVTFKNGGINKIINQVSLGRIILETDSPYLSPTPFRGTRNESKYLLNIAHKMAELYNIDIEDIAKKTTKNAIDLFHL